MFSVIVSITTTNKNRSSLIINDETAYIIKSLIGIVKLFQRFFNGFVRNHFFFEAISTGLR